MLVLAVDARDTLRRLLDQEDTDGDKKITIKDKGPKEFVLNGVLQSGLEGNSTISGTFHLACLLQDLAMCLERGDSTLSIDVDSLGRQNVIDRVSSMIKDRFWDALTRQVDANGLAAVLLDEKARAESPSNIVYVPHSDPQAQQYFINVAQELPELDLSVVVLPPLARITPEYVQQLNKSPGILSLSLREGVASTTDGVPFVVPGGRFNEMYGWDSYFEALGLLQDGRVQLAKDMTDNLVYEIHHYGKILNANRTYYLSRSQPPFLTSLARAVYASLPARGGQGQGQSQGQGGVETEGEKETGGGGGRGGGG